MGVAAWVPFVMSGWGPIPASRECEVGESTDRDCAITTPADRLELVGVGTSRTASVGLAFTRDTAVTVTDNCR